MSKADDARKDNLLFDVGCPRMLYNQDPCGDRVVRGAQGTSEHGRDHGIGNRDCGLRCKEEEGRKDCAAAARCVKERLRGHCQRTRHRKRVRPENWRRPLVPGVLAGRRSLRLHSAVFGCLRSSPSPTMSQLSVANIRDCPSICILDDLSCGPPCVTQLMSQPQRN